MEKLATKTVPPASSFYVLIVAAGTGTRMGGGTVPKQYGMLAGKPLLRHTVERFLACPGLREVRVVIGRGQEALYEDAVAGLGLPPPVIGGNTRKESVYNGLISFSDVLTQEPVLIHDAARPFVRREEIEALVSALQDAKAATLAVPVADTLCRQSGETVDRSDLWTVQTPQGFHYNIIREAHEQARDADFTDDAGLARAAGHDVRLVPGRRDNFKITTADDWDLADKMLKG